MFFVCVTCFLLIVYFRFFYDNAEERNYNSRDYNFVENSFSVYKELKRYSTGIDIAFIQTKFSELSKSTHNFATFSYKVSQNIDIEVAQIALDIRIPPYFNNFLEKNTWGVNRCVSETGSIDYNFWFKIKNLNTYSFDIFENMSELLNTWRHDMPHDMGSVLYASYLDYTENLVFVGPFEELEGNWASTIYRADVELKPMLKKEVAYTILDSDVIIGSSNECIRLASEYILGSG